MESTIRNIIIAGIILVLVAGGGLFIIRRLGIGQKIANNPTDSQPLGETPQPTRLPFATATPFPLLTLPSGTPRPTVTASPRVAAAATTSASATPVTIYSCPFLTLTPSEGTAPLTVKFSVTGTAAVGANREYEFLFGDGQSTKQTGTTVSHQYTTAGEFIAELKVRDGSGNDVDLGQTCRESVSIKGKPGVSKGGQTDELPKTGFPIVGVIALIPAAIFGGYLFKKYKLV